MQKKTPTLFYYKCQVCSHEVADYRGEACDICGSTTFELAFGYTHDDRQFARDVIKSCEKLGWKMLEPKSHKLMVQVDKIMTISIERTQRYARVQYGDQVFDNKTPSSLINATFLRTAVNKLRGWS